MIEVISDIWGRMGVDSDWYLLKKDVQADLVCDMVTKYKLTWRTVEARKIYRKISCTISTT